MSGQGIDRTDLREILDELNASFAGFSGREDLMTAELRAICKARGLRVSEIVWSDGEWGGRVADIRLAPEAGEITVEIVRGER